MSDYLDNLKKIVMSRRAFIAGAGAVATYSAVSWVRQAGPLFVPSLFPEKWWFLKDQKPPESPVAILKAATYEQDLVSVIKEGIRLCGISVRGKSVLLKPNLVEYSPTAPINTHPQVVLAAIEAFRSLDAGNVIVAEGAGHRRDTELMVEATGLGPLLRQNKVDFIDLNLDDVSALKLKSSFMGAPELYFSKTLLAADLVVSMPKLKTHHWAGATLAMKNLFGCIPGSVYGWPKNFLHWCGIDESIVDITAALRPGFAIVDGIVGMEGNGPINGTAKPFGALIFGTDMVAVDATCTRLMQLNPDQILYLSGANRFLGQTDPAHISQRGESIASLAQPFALPPRLQGLRPPPQKAG